MLQHIVYINNITNTWQLLRITFKNHLFIHLFVECLFKSLCTFCMIISEERLGIFFSRPNLSNYFTAIKIRDKHLERLLCEVYWDAFLLLPVLACFSSKIHYRQFVNGTSIFDDEIARGIIR